MLKSLTLENFKGFRRAQVPLAPLTAIVGVNASGKSNIRDAFRFMHGVGRGLTVAEVIGGTREEVGSRAWAGIRGGARELCFHGETTCSIAVTLDAAPASVHWPVDVGDRTGGPAVLNDTPVPMSFVEYLRAIRFAEFEPGVMRTASPPGLSLGSHGENLPSVLRAIWQLQSARTTALEWLRQLVPMDVADFAFEEDPAGRVYLFTTQQDGTRVSADSMSDGTLRFLGLLAALLQPQPPPLLFVEEIENGIHPSRLALVVQLLSQATAKGVQVVLTTHSPQLLDLLPPQARQDALLTYRLENEPDCHVTRLLGVEHAAEVLATEPLATLHSTGWFEKALYLNGAGEEHVR
jgi:hypothetical protein